MAKKSEEFHNEALGCKFTLPDPFCLRHVEQYEAAKVDVKAAGAQFGISINWAGAVGILENWECEALPDLDKLTPEDLADVHGPALQVVTWVAGEVYLHVMKQLFIPKN